MANLTGSHLIVRALKLEGIKRIFTIVGDTILPLCDVAFDEGIDFIDTRHEAAAMGMADAWARITGEPAVALFTGGPGFSNAISGLPNVYTSESPVIFIAGCGELSERGMHSFQEIDQVRMAAPVTKGSWLVHERKRIPDFIAKAFRTALSGRPGPVHLTIPVDLQEQQASEDELPQYQPNQYRHKGRSYPDPSLINEALQFLSRAEKPVIIAGNPARYSVSSATLQNFIENTGIPLFTVEQSRGLVSDDHPLCFGYADGALNGAARHFREADVVLLLGKRLDHRYRYGNAHFFSPDTHLIQIDPSETEIGYNRGVSVGIVADLGVTVETLLKESKKFDWPNLTLWRSQLKESREAWLEQLSSFATDDVPLHPMRIFKEVEQFIDDDTTIIIDGGDYVQWGRSYLKARKPGRWMRIGPLGHLGFGLPYALASKLAYPDDKVFLFTGDGSFGFYAMEYDTAIRHNLPITSIMGNDATWGIDKNFQLAYYGRAVATDLRTVRYDKVVEAMGGHGEYVEQAHDINPAIKRAINSTKPSLVNVAIKSLASPLADAMISRKQGPK